MPSVLITGASRGLGAALVRVYSERRWTVFGLVRDPADASRLAGSPEVRCLPIVADVTCDEVMQRIEQGLAGRTASLDLLVNNAGGIRKERGLMKTSACDLEDHFAAHCAGVLRCTKAALPYLMKAGRPIVVNITSRWGSIARTVAGRGGRIYAYQIAKCAQNMLTACLDDELRGSGIRVLAVHPGRLRTEVAAPDADTDPDVAAARLADWLEGVDGSTVCGCHDLMGGGLVAW